MIAFRVWIGSFGNHALVRVEGADNAQWLLRRLSQSFVFKGSEAIREDGATHCSHFEIPYSSQMPRLTLERLLGSIPEVRLLAEPA